MFEISNHLSEGFNLFGNTYKWFTFCKCDGELKGHVAQSLSAVRMSIQSEGEVFDMTEQWATCQHDKVQGDPWEGSTH